MRKRDPRVRRNEKSPSLLQRKNSQRVRAILAWLRTRYRTLRNGKPQAPQPLRQCSKSSWFCFCWPILSWASCLSWTQESLTCFLLYLECYPHSATKYSYTSDSDELYTVSLSIANSDISFLAEYPTMKHHVYTCDLKHRNLFIQYLRFRSKVLFGESNREVPTRNKKQENWSPGMINYGSVFVLQEMKVGLTIFGEFGDMRRWSQIDREITNNKK